MHDEDETGFADDPDALEMMTDAVIREKIKAFQDPILQKQYEMFMEDENELLSLDAIIAASKVRFGVAVRKGKHIEVSQLLRSLTEAIEKAIEVREKQREYVHLEQALWLMQMNNEIVHQVVSNQDEARECTRRMSKLVLPSREDIPLDIRQTARALAEGRRLKSGK